MKVYELFLIIMMIMRPELSSVFVTTNQRQKSFVCGQKASAEAISYVQELYFLFLRVVYSINII